MHFKYTIHHLLAELFKIFQFHQLNKSRKQQTDVTITCSSKLHPSAQSFPEFTRVVAFN
jgi:hypothetical protein